jgi:integrase/recombinase XerD
MRPFASFIENQGSDVTLDSVREYFAKLRDTEYSANTIRIRRQAVKARLRAVLDSSMDFNKAAAFREALARMDHDSETKAPKIQAAPIGSDKVIRRDELDRMLSVASRRDWLLIKFLWTTGARVGELCGARLARCEVKGKTAFVTICGKGSKERTLRIRTTLFEQIRAEFKGSTYLFETAGGKPFSTAYVSTRVHRLALSVLGRRLGAHSLRHSFATRQIRRTNKVQAVSTYLGHSSTAITLSYYVHEQLEDDELFDVEDEG